MLVHVVQFAADDFIVVEPHDFIEVLSWSDSDQAGDAEVTKRVREQATKPDRLLRKLLVPFSVTLDIMMAVIDLDATALQVLHQKPEQDLYSRANDGSDGSDDGFETTMVVYSFINTLFPDQCPRYGAWNIDFERTVHSAVVINKPGIVSGSYMNEAGRRLQLQSILPFFFEVLQIVCGVETRKAIDDLALLTRLFAIFEDPPGMELSKAVKHLRKFSQAELTRSLEGRIQNVLKSRKKEFKAMIVGTEPSGKGSHAPQELIYMRPRANKDVSNAVTQSYNATVDLMAQYAQIRFLLEAMADRGIMAESFLHHKIFNDMAQRSFYLVDARKETLEPAVALNQFRFQGLKDLAKKIHKMKAELDHWLGMIHKHLDSAVI